MNNFKYTIDFKDNKDDDFYGNKNEDGSVCFMKKIDSADDFFYTVRDLIKRLPDRISREDYNRDMQRMEDGEITYDEGQEIAYNYVEHNSRIDGAEYALGLLFEYSAIPSEGVDGNIETSKDNGIVFNINICKEDLNGCMRTIN
jgi:hypothetical protein